MNCNLKSFQGHVDIQKRDIAIWESFQAAVRNKLGKEGMGNAHIYFSGASCMFNTRWTTVGGFPYSALLWLLAGLRFSNFQIGVFATRPPPP